MSGGRRGRREAADGGDGRRPPRRRTRDRAQLGAPLRPRPRWPQSGRPPPLHRDRLRSPRAHAAPGGRGRDAGAGCRAGAGHAGGRHRGERGVVGAGAGQDRRGGAGGAASSRRAPGGRSLAVPGASPEVRGLARAASRLDAEALVDLLTNLLVERGAVATWDDVLRPVLVAAGLRWQRTGEGVDVEHVLSEATTEALRAHRARLLRPVPGRPVLLACAPEDAHVLPLHVAAVALAERRVPVRLLGPGVPPTRWPRRPGARAPRRSSSGVSGSRARQSTWPGCRARGRRCWPWSAARGGGRGRRRRVPGWRRTCAAPWPCCRPPPADPRAPQKLCKSGRAPDPA